MDCNCILWLFACCFRLRSSNHAFGVAVIARCPRRIPTSTSTPPAPAPATSTSAPTATAPATSAPATSTPAPPP